MLVLLIVAIKLKDPHLFAFRRYETAMLLVFAVAGIVFYLRGRRKPERLAAIVLLPIVLVLTLYGEGWYQYRKHAVLSADPQVARQLGVHFIVGYGEADELQSLVGKGLVAGMFVTQHNAKGKSATQLGREIGELQVLRKASGLPKLIVATDQEGGAVSRLSPPLDNLPSLAALANGQFTAAELQGKAEAYGREQGAELASLGVTVNFSPVVDLKSGRADNPLDFHSQIDQRAVSALPSLTAEVAQAYVRGLESQGVSATLKHFPGLGRVASDTHLFSAMLDTPVSELDSHDWLPFKQVAGGSHVLIMLGHVILGQIDSENPVSFSRLAVQNIIRGAWKFEGVLITDDMTMAAAYNHGICDASVKSLNAGVDLLLVSYDYDQFYEAMYCALRAFENGELNREWLNLSHKRLGYLVQNSQVGLTSGSPTLEAR